jgi:superfamily II DNA or RNA helicase
MSAPELRPYQTDVIAQFHRAVVAGRKRIMLVAPTGSGKTVIAAAIVRGSVDVGHRVLILSHRREITRQTISKLYDLGIDAGIIQAGWPPRPGQAVQVASIQTLHRRGELPPADLVIVDEAHHSPANTYRKVLEKYPAAVVLGLTATPCRKDGRGLGNVFDVLIECPQVGELIEGGFLVPSVVYAPTTPDLQGVRTQAGDYVESQLAERMDRPELVGDVVTHWHRHGDRRKTVIFATNVAHSLHMRDELVKSGVRAEHLDGSTPTEDRDAILKRLATGDTEVVSNCMVLTEGVDIPEVSCLVLARPTKSLGLFRQMIGRGLRPAAGKANCVILDHSGAVFQHGLPEDPIAWTLHTDAKAANVKHAIRGANYRSRLTTCPKCDALRTGGEACRVCGWEPKRHAEAVDVLEGDLGRIDRNGTRATVHDQDQWHRQLVFIANERGYRPGWAAHKFKEKFGHWPSRRDVTPQPASAEVRSWVRSRQIAYAKAMQKTGRAA